LASEAVAEFACELPIDFLLAKSLMVRVERRGKSSPAFWETRKPCKPYPEQHRPGTEAIPALARRILPNGWHKPCGNVRLR